MTKSWIPGPSCRTQRRHGRNDRLISTSPPGPETEFGARDTTGLPRLPGRGGLLSSEKRGCLDPSDQSIVVISWKWSALRTVG